MYNHELRKWIRIGAAVVVTAALITGMGTLVGYAGAQYIVSQKGRQFHPGELTLKRGETITIVNDDGDLRHHAYIDFGQIQIRLRRPGAGQQDRRHVLSGRHLRRALRHSSEDEAGRSRRPIIFRFAQLSDVPNSKACAS